MENNNNKTIMLQLKLEEVNVMLEALSRMPYIQVSNIIHSIQLQANQQLEQLNGTASASKTKKKATVETTT